MVSQPVEESAGEQEFVPTPRQQQRADDALGRHAEPFEVEFIYEMGL